MEPKTNRILLPKDIYRAFIHQYVEKRPYLKIVRRKCTKRVMPLEVHDEQGNIILTFDRWFNMVTTFVGKAREAIIDGQRLQLAGNMGYIHARRVERNYSNRKINWQATKMYGVRYDEQLQRKVPMRKVYYTDEDYCRIAWSKRGIGLKAFKFCPTNSSKTKKGFKEQFSTAIIENPTLKLKYIYYQTL